MLIEKYKFDIDIFTNDMKILEFFSDFLKSNHYFLSHT